MPEVAQIALLLDNRKIATSIWCLGFVFGGKAFPHIAPWGLVSL